METTVLDVGEVGARCIIGANELVTMGMKIPPGSLVLGSPAKIRRQLTLDEQKDIARWAWSYVETAKQYREFYCTICHQKKHQTAMKTTTFGSALAVLLALGFSWTRSSAEE